MSCYCSLKTAVLTAAYETKVGDNVAVVGDYKGYSSKPFTVPLAAVVNYKFSLCFFERKPKNQQICASNLDSAIIAEYQPAGIYDSYFICLPN